MPNPSIGGRFQPNMPETASEERGFARLSAAHNSSKLNSRFTRICFAVARHLFVFSNKPERCTMLIPNRSRTKKTICPFASLAENSGGNTQSVHTISGGHHADC
jgi:hypothetical protein